MPKLTLLSRISDGLPLAASMEDEKDHRELDGYKAQAKKLLKTMSNGTPARVSVESGGSVFQCARASDTPHPRPQGRTCLTKPATAPACRSYINQEGVCYMCLTEKSYPKRCAPGSCTAALAHPTHPAASAPLSRDVPMRLVRHGTLATTRGRDARRAVATPTAHAHTAPPWHPLGACALQASLQLPRGAPEGVLLPLPRRRRQREPPLRIHQVWCARSRDPSSPYPQP